MAQIGSVCFCALVEQCVVFRIMYSPLKCQVELKCHCVNSVVRSVIEEWSINLLIAILVIAIL